MTNSMLYGDVAHVVERLLCMQEVRGPMPRISTFCHYESMQMWKSLIFMSLPKTMWLDSQSI